MINSRQGFFRCGPEISLGRPYTEGTAAFLPSSLANNHPFALVDLHLPTCVGLRYVCLYINLRSFSWKRAHLNFTLRQFSQCSNSPCGLAGIFLDQILTLETLNPIIRSNYSTPSFLRIYKQGQNINWLSIAIPYSEVWLRLGTPNPPLIVIAEETSGFRRSGLSPDLRLLIPTFSLPNAPAHFTVYLRCIRNAPLPLNRLKIG